MLKVKGIQKSIRLILLIYIFILIISVISSVFYYRLLASQLINERYEYIYSLAESKVSRIEQWVDERIFDAERIHSSSLLPLLINNSGYSIEFKMSELNKWFYSYNRFMYYDKMVIVNRDGKILFSSPSELSMTQFDKELINESLYSDQVIFSDSKDSSIADSLSKIYIPIVRDKFEKIESNLAIILSVNPKEALKKIINQDRGNAKSLENILMKTSGDTLVFISPYTYYGSKALLNVSTINAEKRIVQGIDLNNNKVIARFSKIKHTNWLLLTKIDKDEFYLPLEEFRKTIILVTTVFDLFIALILIFIWRKSIIENYKKMYEAEIERLKSESRFNSLVKGIKDYAIYIMDKDGYIKSWNIGMEKIKGYSGEEIIGQHFSIFYQPEDREKNRSARSLRLASENGHYEEEGIRIRKDGSRFWADIYVTPLYDNQNKIYGFIKITRDLSLKREYEERLRQSEAELRGLASQLQNVREVEREKIARDVHDDLGQLLSGINLNILFLRDLIDKEDRVEKEDLHKYLLEIRNLVDQGIQSVRNIAEGLRSYVLDHLGLIQAIREYSKDYQNISKIRCDVISSSDDIKISAEKSITIYRIVQEALTNVMRHAKATEIKINFNCTSETLFFTIVDNGIGINLNENRNKKTFGILGMKERVNFLNGNFEIINSGNGTTIKVSIPIQL
ncbi:MAG: PAS domain-containing sensor histidine kinase [Melioribacteraceae bacterium]|nr:PAS domain-containing sensor histidine kinase [Melioribacteraceae bacterium]